MIFRQVIHKLAIGEYLRLARDLGVAFEHILETHNHADHVSGHGRLAAATGATIHIHEDAQAVVGFLLRLFGALRAGAHAVTTDTVRAVTGSEPRGIAEFARDHAGAFGGERSRGEPNRLIRGNPRGNNQIVHYFHYVQIGGRSGRWRTIWTYLTPGLPG